MPDPCQIARGATGNSGHSPSTSTCRDTGAQQVSAPIERGGPKLPQLMTSTCARAPNNPARASRSTRARCAVPASSAASGLVRSTTPTEPVRCRCSLNGGAGPADRSSVCRGSLAMATWSCAVTHFRVTSPAVWGVVEPGEETSRRSVYKGCGSAKASTSRPRRIDGRYIRES